MSNWRCTVHIWRILGNASILNQYLTCLKTVCLALPYTVNPCMKDGCSWFWWCRVAQLALSRGPLAWSWRSGFTTNRQCICSFFSQQLRKACLQYMHASVSWLLRHLAAQATCQCLLAWLHAACSSCWLQQLWDCVACLWRHRWDASCRCVKLNFCSSAA